MNFVDGLVERSHVGYIVEDVDAALKSLQTQLQCAIGVETYLFTTNKVWTDDAPLQDLTLKIAICKITDKITFEYIQPVSQNGYHFAALKEAGEGVNHVCFITEDFEGYRAQFRSLGAKILFEAEANDPKNGYRRCFYAKLPGIPGVLEIAENPKPYREDL